MGDNTDTDVVVPVTPDEAELEKVTANLDAAKEQHEKATKEVLENANEYAKEGMDEESKLLEAARNAQMLNSKKWYKFWETATKIPKDNKYETFTTNEKRTWKTIVTANEDFMREVISEAGIEGVSWKKVMNKGGIKMTYSPEKSETFKTRMYKCEYTIKNATPRLVLLGLVRGPVLGSVDEDLVYFREHYNFVGGTTYLVHNIRKLVASERVSARDFFDLTHWSEEEDGSIFYTASSVKAFPSTMPGVVRGATLLKGFHLKPVGNDVAVTMISQVDPKGWAPTAYMNWYVPYKLVSEVKAIEQACVSVTGQGNDERFIRKFVLRELDVE